MDPAMATIIMFAGDFAPKYWALCSGQLMAINQNQALFSLLGTTYGGDGRTTFGLPDLRSRTPVHAGNGGVLPSYVLGEKTGSETVTLNSQNLPAHNHSASLSFGVSSQTANVDEPDGSVPGTGTINAYKQGAAQNGKLGGVTLTVQPAGGNQPVSIRQPYLAIHFIICLSGIFPSRN